MLALDDFNVLERHGAASWLTGICVAVHPLVRGVNGFNRVLDLLRHDDSAQGNIAGSDTFGEGQDVG